VTTTTTTTRARGGHLLATAVGAAAAAAVAAVPPPCHASSAAAAALAVGELDPATAKAVAGVAGPALSALGFLFVARIVMSWYPRLPVTEFPYVVAYAPTEPLLAATRRVIPPLGGVDVTPVVWFGLVSFLSEILVGPQGLLVLLSQQQQVAG
jgi:YggT family protein